MENKKGREMSRVDGRQKKGSRRAYEGFLGAEFKIPEPAACLEKRRVNSSSMSQLGGRVGGEGDGKFIRVTAMTVSGHTGTDPVESHPGNEQEQHVTCQVGSIRRAWIERESWSTRRLRIGEGGQRRGKWGGDGPREERLAQPNPMGLLGDTHIPVPSGADAWSSGRYYLFRVWAVIMARG